MGYITSAITTTLTAKLTPIGRQRLITNNNLLITKFALGDSDANYNASLSLTGSTVPGFGGDVGVDNTINNSVSNDARIKNFIIVNTTGVLTKAVEPTSIKVNSSISSLGQVTVSGTGLTQNIININDTATDQLVNLFNSFSLPLNSSERDRYTATTFSSGGFSDTAISGFATDKILVIGIDNSLYGENLDGKVIRVDLTTTANTYTIYSTFENKRTPLTTEDANYKDTSTSTQHLGASQAFLFSDDVLEPNGGDVTKSWATGFGTVKPFSVNGKELYNLVTNSNLGLTADSCVGIAYLDKGFLVITNSTIVNDFDLLSSGATATTVILDSIATSVSQDITCIADRGEFGTSSNSTWSTGDIVRITEIGLYDNSNNLIAIAKSDRQILKTKNAFLALGITINL